MEKLVSVIIPTYSRPVNLCRAIDSVLNQTYRNVEVIVVDDNGIGNQFQKETECVLNKYLSRKNFFYLRHEINRNGSAARNTGVKFSHGEYIAFLDDDDEFLPSKLEIQVKVLERLDNSWGGCYCNINLIGRRKKSICNRKSGNLTEDLLLGNIRFNTSTLLFRREVYLSLGGFDESFIRHQDWEFMIRFFREYKLCLPNMACLVNKYSSRKGFSNIPAGRKFIEIKKQFLEIFKDDIESLKSANDIYHKHWIEVASLLLCDKNWKLFCKYLRMANKYKCISFHDIRYILFSFLSSL